MSVVIVLRAMAHLVAFSAVCILATGTIVAGVSAAIEKPISVCSYPGCSFFPTVADVSTNRAVVEAPVVRL